MKAHIKFIFLCCFALLPFSGFAESQADIYLAAKKAALRSDWTQFAVLKDKLGDYPLSPYLDYFFLRGNFKKVSASAIQQYLDKYPNTPMSVDLRRKWLMDLANLHQWDQYKKIYAGNNSVNLECYYYEALQKTQDPKNVNAEIEKLWLTGNAQPENCNAVFEHWLQTQPNKSALLWQRFDLALKSYNFDLARFLTTKMTAEKRNEAQAILQLYDKPQLVTQKAYLNNHPYPEVISYGIARLARRDPNMAIQTWQKLSKQYHFTQAQEQRIFQAIALKFTFQKNKNSAIWYRKLIGTKLDPVYQEWMIRSALINGDWLLVKDTIAAMPSPDKEKSEWQYWYARALDQLGEKAKANEVFTKLMQTRDYYGFLASHYTKQKVNVIDSAPKVTAAEIEQVKTMPGFIRAKLLYELNQQSDAKLELYYLIKNTNMQQQYIITKLVSDWGWQTGSLGLTRYAEYKDDVSLRFPLIYRDTVFYNADLRKLNPAFIYAVIRQESFFIPNAVSPAGAVGLMQLMPHTAAKTSKQFKLKYSGSKDLLDAETNIAFGSAHLRSLHEELNNPILVIASYNAGKEAVNRWMPKTDKQIPADIWIETIPFKETRHYLKNVISFYVVYQYRLGQKPDVDTMMQGVK